MLGLRSISRWCAGDTWTQGGAHGHGAGPIPRAFLEQPVLIIEDEAMIAWMLESMLEDLGFISITVAALGEEAVAAADRVRPGLVVSDINLGTRGMDGITAAIAIRGSCMTPVVFVTGHAGVEETDRIERDLPDALLLKKPVTEAELRRVLLQLSQGMNSH